MSYLLKTIQLFNNGIATTVIDDERTNVKISMGNKGSGLSIILKNAYQEHVLNGEFKWKETDTVKLFLKYSDTSGDSIDTSSSTDLIITAEIEEYEAILEENSTSWVLKCVDKSYTLLNKLWAKAYFTTDNPTVNGLIDLTKTGWTPPELITDIIKINTATGSGGSDVNAKLAIGTFDSDGLFQRTGGGYIQNVRPDNSTFDSLRTELTLAKVFKPVYEWIEDLSTIERTNTIAEQAATLVAARPYFFYIDENNNAHWEYPGTTTANYEMTVGSTSTVGSDTVTHVIHSVKLKKSVFDIVNMIIYNAGQDFEGNGILDYFYDPTTKSPVLKPVYKPMIDIAKQWKSEEIKRGLNTAPVDYTLNNDTGTILRGDNRKYDASYNFTPKWGGAEVTSDETLNDSLRTQCIAEGDSRASAITQKRANARWRGTISLKGYKYQVGNLIQFNDSLHGIVDAKVRITDVQHTISANGWFVTLTVEEDAEEKTN